VNARPADGDTRLGGKPFHFERPCRCDPNPFQCGEGCTCVGCGCMKERPVLFTGGNVIEIQEDRKTQTRRMVKDPAKPEPGAEWGECVCREIDPADQPCVRCEAIAGPCPYGKPGDRLWVRETWAVGKGYDADPHFKPPGAKRARALPRAKVSDMHPGIRMWYRAGDGRPASWCKTDWEHFDDLRFEARPDHKARGQWRPSIFMPRWASRLQLEVTRVRVERLNSISPEDAIAEGVTQFYEWALDPVGKYRELWESINGAGSWALNPWVWCIDFKRVGVTCG
jgi:hypothetical protein